MQIFNDPDLGQIVIKPHAKAKRIIARQRNGFIQLTVPLRFRLKDLPPSWSSLKPKLLQLRKTPPGIFSEGDTFSTFSSTAKIMRSPLIGEKFRVSVKNGELLVLVPESTDFADIAAQQKIKALLISALKWEAKKILPEKTSALAQKKRIELFRSSSFIGYNTLGKLLRQAGNQPVALPDALAGETHRLRNPARIGAHGRDEP